MKLEIKGVNEMTIKLSASKLTANANKALTKFGIRVDKDAKQLTPVDDGRIRSGIFFTPSVNLEVKVGCAVNYAAYVEFGTGPYAAYYVPALPVEWQQYAKKFYVNGQGTTPAHPFIYPAVNKNIPQLEKDLKNSLND